MNCADLAASPRAIKFSQSVQHCSVTKPETEELDQPYGGAIAQHFKFLAHNVKFSFFPPNLLVSSKRIKDTLIV